jgi:hypothetical protein
VSALLFAALPNAYGTNNWFLEGAAVIVAPVVAAAVLVFVQRTLRAPRGRGALVAGAFASVALAMLANDLMATDLVSDRAYALFLIVGSLLVAIALTASLAVGGPSPASRRLLGWSALLGLGVSLALPLFVTSKWVAQTGWEEAVPRVRYAWATDSLLELADDRPGLYDDAAGASGWLRSHHEAGDILASVAPTTTWMSALTGMRLYASFPEQVGSWSKPPALTELAHRQGLLHDYVARPSTQTLAPLCAAGVRWIWWPVGVSPGERGAGELVRFGDVAVERVC